MEIDQAESVTEATQRDLRETTLYREAADLYKLFRQPGTGQISDAAEVSVAPDGEHAVFAATFVDALEGTPPTRICGIDLCSGEVRVLTFGPNTDRLPKYSPDGRYVAFLSDRQKAGSFQLYLLDPAQGVARAAGSVKGWVEYLHWSPDGRRILLGVAGEGADIAGAQGAIPSKRVADQAAPSWIPAVETGDESYRWRRVWVYDFDTRHVRQISREGSNIWEAAWCGSGAVVAVVSPGPGEGLWYAARLHIIDIETGNSREVYVPQDQIASPAACLSGKRLAVIEGLCSDRGSMAGDLQLIETSSRKAHRVNTQRVDISHLEWQSEHELLLAGHRGFETVVARYDVRSEEFSEVWSSRDVTSGGRYATVAGLGALGDCVLVGENYGRAPEIALIRRGEYRTLKSFDSGYDAEAKAIESAECVAWKAPDGIEIQGWLLLPKAKGPYPLIVAVHGGPTSHWRPLWLGRRNAHLLMLIKRGYAVFFPNPRGSSGRGQTFVRLVLGDLGGADTYDHLSGIDHLVKLGIADPRRLGVTGTSYGGFMTSWLITQDARFAAAVPVAPHTNQVTQHLLSNIPGFLALFLGERYDQPGGKYFERSPIMHAHKVKTPTLNVCGAQDRCTPPGEAAQFHNALLENEVTSVLVTYPEEGHGIRKFPAAIDYAARLVSWFERFMPPDALVRNRACGSG